MSLNYHGGYGYDDGCGEKLSGYEPNSVRSNYHGGHGYNDGPNSVRMIEVVRPIMIMVRSKNTRVDHDATFS